MSAPTDCRVTPPDPTDAKAADQFVSHRAGYGDDLDDLMRRALKGYTLAAGEGRTLAQEIERLRGIAKELALDVVMYARHERGWPDIHPALQWRYERDIETAAAVLGEEMPK